MKKSSTLAVIAALDLLIGFSIQAYVLLRVGIGAATDGYFAGQILPVILLGIIQLPLQRAMLASFSEFRDEGYPAGRLLVAALLFMAVPIGILAALAPWLIELLYGNLPAAAQDTAASVLRVQSLAVVVMTGNLVLMSLNHVDGRFLQCEVSLLTASVAGALFVFLAVDRLGVVAAAYGQLVKAGISAGLYLAPLRSELTWGTPPWQRLVAICGPLVSAGTITKLGPLIDRSIASLAPTGALSVLTFTQSIYSATSAVAERALIAPRLPQCTAETSNGSLLKVASGLAMLGAAVTAALLAAGYALWRWGIADHLIAQPVLAQLIQCILWLAGLSVGALSTQWMAAAMTVRGHSIVTAKIVTWGFLFSLPLKIGGFVLGGIRGLAVAISAYHLLNALAFALAVRRLQAR